MNASSVVYTGGDYGVQTPPNYTKIVFKYIKKHVKNILNKLTNNLSLMVLLNKYETNIQCILHTFYHYNKFNLIITYLYIICIYKK